VSFQTDLAHLPDIIRYFELKYEISTDIFGRGPGNKKRRPILKNNKKCTNDALF